MELFPRDAKTLEARMYIPKDKDNYRPSIQLAPESPIPITSRMSLREIGPVYRYGRR
ncbi:MAG TPA: hypothetical protein VJK72_05190 [Candidatus Nanoarchaeia archaeon]|nr:hypothetical protein [Candidatus Nanoarchaeia archaeon]